MLDGVVRRAGAGGEEAAEGAADADGADATAPSQRPHKTHRLISYPLWETPPYRAADGTLQLASISKHAPPIYQRSHSIFVASTWASSRI